MKWIIWVPSLAAERLDELVLAVGVARVADESAQTDAAGVRVLEDALGDVVGRVHGHHLAGGDDVDLLGLALAHRHREPAAHDVAEDVVEDEVEVVGVGAFLLEEVDRGDDAAAGATDAGLRAAGLGALDVAEADLQDLFELEVLDRAGARGPCP